MEHLEPLSLTGIGLYTLSGAARLIRAEPREVRRWLLGYPYRVRGEKVARHSAPLWKRQVDAADGVGFHDLLEIRVVKEFVRCGVHLSVIRTALQHAKELFGAEYPFTAHRFLTDGKRVFHEAQKASEASPLTDMARKQVVFDHVIRPSLYKGIDYAKDGSAERWFPMPRSRAIVLDPAISFGAPILADYGIPVDTIAAAVAAENSVARVAQIFGVSRLAVESAVKFEQRLDQ